MSKTKTTMTRDEFWAEVAAIGWGTEGTDHRAAKIAQLRKGPIYCDGMREHFAAVDSALYAKTEMGGGDSADDCRRHIIGLGRAEYDKVMAKPHLAEKRYKSGDYTESFAYVIPHSSDYEDLKPERFTEWAKGDLAELEPHVKPVAAIDRELGGKLARLAEILALVASGDLEAGLELEPEAVSLVALIAKDWAALVKSVGGRLAWSEWSVLNMFSDLRKRAEVLA
jgi:hypothetical protein